MKGLLLFCLGWALTGAVAAQPALKGERGDESASAVIEEKVGDDTLVDWTVDKDRDGQRVWFHVRQRMEAGQFSLGVGGEWADAVQERPSVAPIFAPPGETGEAQSAWTRRLIQVGFSEGEEGTNLALAAQTNLDDLNSGCTLKFKLRQEFEGGLSIHARLESVQELTPLAERSAGFGLGFDRNGSSLQLQLDRDSEGLYELNGLLRERTSRWGTFELGAARKLQQDAETVYRAGYRFDLNGRLSLGAEAQVKPEQDELPEMQIKANLRISW